MRISIVTVHVRKWGLRHLASPLSLQVGGSLVSDPGCVAPKCRVYIHGPPSFVWHGLLNFHTLGTNHGWPMSYLSNEQPCFKHQTKPLPALRQRKDILNTHRHRHALTPEEERHAGAPGILFGSQHRTPVPGNALPGETEPTFHHRSCKRTDFPPLLHRSHSAAHTPDQKPEVQGSGAGAAGGRAQKAAGVLLGQNLAGVAGSPGCVASEAASPPSWKLWAANILCKNAHQRICLLIFVLRERRRKTKGGREGGREGGGEKYP